MTEIGQKYLFKTTTLYYVGLLVNASVMELEVNNCSEVHETGPNARRDGTIKTLEYQGDGVIIPRMGTILIPWEKDLPNGRIS